MVPDMLALKLDHAGSLGKSLLALHAPVSLILKMLRSTFISVQLAQIRKLYHELEGKLKAATSTIIKLQEEVCAHIDILRRIVSACSLELSAVRVLAFASELSLWRPSCYKRSLC